MYVLLSLSHQTSVIHCYPSSKHGHVGIKKKVAHVSHLHTRDKIEMTELTDNKVWPSAPITSYKLHQVTSRCMWALTCIRVLSKVIPPPLFWTKVLLPPKMVGKRKAAMALVSWLSSMEVLLKKSLDKISNKFNEPSTAKLQQCIIIPNISHTTITVDLEIFAQKNCIANFCAEIFVLYDNLITY